MKKFLVIILCIAMTQMSIGQTKSNIGDVRWSFGLGLDILDQYTPSLGGLQTFKAPIDLGQRAWAWVNVNSSIAFEAGLGTTAIQTRKSDNIKYEEKKKLLFNIEGGLVYKFNNGYILKETFPVAPFLFAKVKGSYMDFTGFAGNDWGIGVPVGGGINWRIANDIALNTQVAYTFGVTDDFDNNLTWTFGVMFDLGSPKVKEVIIEPVIEEPIEVDTDGDGVLDEMDDCPTVQGIPRFNGCPDSDGDGIVDAEDACPNEAGLAKFSGCPDMDGDGVADKDDKCPTVPGILKLAGCPNPDFDGDGINDDVDQCPKIPGLAVLSGCPDADGDGVRDSDDRCPTEAGTAINKGCPAVKEEIIKQLEFAAKNIQFETGSAVLKTTSFSKLDEIVKILKEWPNYSVKISGYTDNVGSDVSNLALSQKRAEAAATYLLSKGVNISRVSSEGYGEANPIADNTTATGKATNRRVEFMLFVK